jgi:chromosome segregation ATPase
LGHLAIPQITHSQNSSLSSKPRGVPEEDDDGEGSAKYQAKFMVPEAASEGEVARLEGQRLVELERQLSETLAAQTERDQRLAQLTDELALKSALLEHSEAEAAKATKHAGLEHVDRLDAQVEQKDAELVNMQAKLDELLLSRDKHMRALRQRVGQYETELADVRAELEVRKSELEAVRVRLTDAEMGWVRSKIEADTLRALTTASPATTDEDRITHGLAERMRAMEIGMASLRCSEEISEVMPSRNEG